MKYVLCLIILLANVSIKPDFWFLYASTSKTSPTCLSKNVRKFLWEKKTFSNVRTLFFLEMMSKISINIFFPILYFFTSRLMMETLFEAMKNFYVIDHVRWMFQQNKYVEMDSVETRTRSRWFSSHHRCENSIISLKFLDKLHRDASASFHNKFTRWKFNGRIATKWIRMWIQIVWLIISRIVYRSHCSK